MPSSPFSAWRKKQNICGQLFRRPPKHDCLMSFMYNVATEVISLCKKQSLKRKNNSHWKQRGNWGAGMQFKPCKNGDHAYMGANNAPMWRLLHPEAVKTNGDIQKSVLHSIPKELHLKKLMLPGPFSCPLRNQNSSAREGLILPPLPCIHFVSTVQRGGQDFRWRGSPIAPPLSSMPSFSTANCEIKTPPLVGESNYTLFFAACTPFLVPIRI